MRGDSGSSRSAVVSTGAAPALTLEAAIAGLKPGAPPLCKRLLEGAFSKYTILHNLNAQWAQDWFVYLNYLHDVPREEGFYVDVGANQPVTGSNTWFLDACLGWRGICAEPSGLANGYKGAGRTCEVFHGCVYWKRATLNLEGSGSVGAWISDKPGTVPCVRLDALVGERGVSRVHFLSLDVEGAEMAVLAGWPAGVPVDVVAMENNRGCKPYDEDEHTKRVPLLIRGMVLTAHLLGDDVFVNASDPRIAAHLARGPPAMPHWCVQWEAIRSFHQLKSREAVEGALGLSVNVSYIRPGSALKAWKKAFANEM